MNKRGIGVRNRLSGILLASGIVAAGFCLIGTNTENTAKALNLAVSTPSDPILELSLSSNLVQLNLTPSNGSAFDTANLTATAGTNNLTGYTLYMEIDSPNLTRTEPLANNTTPTIPSLAVNEQGYTEANFTANSWGYQLGEGNYFAIPDDAVFLDSSEGPTNASSTTITFASKVNMEQAAGSYSTDVTLQAVTNAPIPVMQDIDTWRGSIAEGQSIRAIDSRDNKFYWVYKAREGHIWMTQNLDFDIDSTKTYTPADTDLTANWTPVRSTIDATSGTISGWVDDDNTPYSVDVGDWYWIGSYYDSFSDCPSNKDNGNRGCNYLTGYANGKFAETPYADGSGVHGSVGNYYNWSAAVAMNNTSSYGNTYGTPDAVPQTSICPAGWRLPIISSVAGRSEYENLINSDGAGITANDRNMVETPLFFVRGGTISGNALYSAGYLGQYQSATTFGSFQAFSLQIFSNQIIANQWSGTSRPVGKSIRCIARNNNTITFNANGGTGTMTNQTIGEFASAALNSNTFTREGYAFTGWNTAADGSGTPYANGATYSGSSITLYAQWAAATFDNVFAGAGKTKVTVSGNDYYKMQDMTTDICNTVAADEYTTIVDIRDNGLYNVGKIVDGKCWMLDNLSLDLTNATVKDNLSSSTTNASDTTLSYLINGGGTASNRYPVSAVNNYNTTQQYDYGVPLIDMSKKNLTTSALPGGMRGNNKRGGYYDFCAASAGSYCYSSDIGESRDITEDICPAGWRLPTGGDNGEYQGAYVAITDGSTLNNEEKATLYRRTLSLAVAGLQYYGSYFWEDSMGYMATSTVLESDWAGTYMMQANNSSVNPTYSHNIRTMPVVRCIAK